MLDLGSAEVTTLHENWVFLGDSLTEGVGFLRHSYVSELATRLRAESASGQHTPMRVSVVRFRPTDGASRFVRFNHAADLDVDPTLAERSLWLWNLGCEGQTIDTDMARLPLLASLRPTTVVVFRGGLESILRPAALTSGNWPWWVPKSWRGYAAMDPRCYFSSTWWRAAKQRALDTVKQRTRLRLLRSTPSQSLVSVEKFADSARKLLTELSGIVARTVVCGLLPVSGQCFPGSPERFQHINDVLRSVVAEHSAEFLDWGAELVAAYPSGDVSDCFYRDGFHPNQAGCVALAGLLATRLGGQRA